MLGPSLLLYNSFVSRSVVSNSLQPHGLWLTGLLCPWDSLGKNTGLNCYSLLQKSLTNSNEGWTLRTSLHRSSQSYLKNTCICSGILNWTFSLWLSFCFCFFGESPDVVKLRKTSIFHLKTDLEMLGLSNEGMCAWEWKKEREVAQSCPTLCGPMDCSPPDSSIHEIFQARVLEWVGISFSRASSWLRDRTQVSRTAGGFFTVWATKEACIIKSVF